MEEFEVQGDQQAEALRQLTELISPRTHPFKYFGLGEPEMNVLFAAASADLRSGAYAEAMDAFRFLCFLNPEDPRYWMGLGQSLRSKEKFHEALEAYSMAARTAAEDPRPHFHAASCLLALKMPERARSTFILSIELCEGKPQFASLRESCWELIDDLNDRARGRNYA